MSNATPAHPAAHADRALKVIVAGGHPDDPASGCGGTMALYAEQGHEVVAMYLTRGEAGIPGRSHEETAQRRTAEAQAACDVLHARPVFVGQVDGDTEITDRWYRAVRHMLEREQPDVVFTHWPIDAHRDHRVASLLVYDAWLRMESAFNLVYYEVLSGSQTQHFSPTHYVDITAAEPRKRRACLAHHSQHPARFYAHHEQMHHRRGLECGCRYAEAFARHISNPNEAVLLPGTARVRRVHRSGACGDGESSRPQSTRQPAMEDG
jgi:N-acetylglucosamine malate deacetylase 1